MQWQALSPKEWKTFCDRAPAAAKKAPSRAPREGVLSEIPPYFQLKSRYMKAENWV